MHFEARIYKPDEDAGEQYAVYELEAPDRAAALAALQDPLDGVYFPELGDRLLALLGDEEN